MNERIDATRAIELAREDMEEKRERALRREDALEQQWTEDSRLDEQKSALGRPTAEIVLAKAKRMSCAIDEMNELVKKTSIEVARKYEVDEDTLLSHCQTQDGFVEGSPADLAGRLEWILGQLSESVDLVHLECKTTLPLTTKILSEVLRGAILVVEDARRIWRQQAKSEKAFDHQSKATKTLTDGAFSCAPQTPQGEKE